MPNPLAQYVLRVRKEKGLSQEELAGQLGVCRSLVSQWESGKIPMARSQLPALARVLGTTEEDIGALWVPGLPGLTQLGRTLGATWREGLFLPPYPVKGTVEEMFTWYPESEGTWQQAVAGMTAAQQADLRLELPRDSALELFGFSRLLAMGARIHFLRPLDFLFRRLVVVRETERYAGDLLRHGLVLSTERFTFVGFTQVSIQVPAQSRERRPDLLVFYREGRDDIWLDIEMDGGGSLRWANDDARRAVGLGLPRLGYETKAIRAHNFVPRLLSDCSRQLAARRTRTSGTRPRSASTVSRHTLACESAGM